MVAYQPFFYQDSAWIASFYPQTPAATLTGVMNNNTGSFITLTATPGASAASLIWTNCPPAR